MSEAFAANADVEMSEINDDPDADKDDERIPEVICLDSEGESTAANVPLARRSKIDMPAISKRFSSMRKF